MNKLSFPQRKALSDFANTIAAAWFTAGVISPFFTKPSSVQDVILFALVGIFMTWIMMSWSLTLVKGV